MSSVAKLPKRKDDRFKLLLVTQSVSKKSGNNQTACCGLIMLLTSIVFLPNQLFDLFLVKWNRTYDWESTVYLLT